MPYIPRNNMSSTTVYVVEYNFCLFETNYLSYFVLLVMNFVLRNILIKL